MRLICVLLFLFHFSNGKALTIDEKIIELYDVTINKNKITEHTNEIKQFCIYLKKYNHLSRKKQLKKIYNETKKRYLSNYKLSSFFSDLYTTKTYNCVTGSALYSLVLDELNIPYEIVSVPRHVYVVAYPNDLKITLDATLGQENSIFYWTESSLTSAVNYLLITGQITEVELSILGVDAIFEKFFYTNSKLDFNNLLGFQYFNKSLYYYSLEQYKKAYNMINKAFVISQNKEFVMVKSLVLEGLIVNTKLSDIDIVDYLTEYYEISKSDVLDEKILIQYKIVIFSLFETDAGTEYNDSSLVLINSNISDIKKQNDFLSYFHLVRSVQLQLKSKMNSALAEAKLSYELGDKSLIFEEQLVEVLLKKAWTKYVNSSYSAEKIFKVMNNQMESYPFLKNNTRYQKDYLGEYANYIEYCFNQNKGDLGKIELRKFNKMANENDPDLKEIIDYNYVNIYASVSTYYYRDKQFAEALIWINKAIDLDPDFTSLKNKKRYILTELEK